MILNFFHFILYINIFLENSVNALISVEIIITKHYISFIHYVILTVKLIASSFSAIFILIHISCREEFWRSSDRDFYSRSL